VNVGGVSYIRLTEMHTAKPLAPESSSFEVEISTKKLQRYKTPGLNDITA